VLNKIFIPDAYFELCWGCCKGSTADRAWQALVWLRRAALDADPAKLVTTPACTSKGVAVSRIIVAFDKAVLAFEQLQ
jgi:hypothetical protein